MWWIILKASFLFLFLKFKVQNSKLKTKKSFSRFRPVVIGIADLRGDYFEIRAELFSPHSSLFFLFSIFSCLFSNILGYKIFLCGLCVFFLRDLCVNPFSSPK